MNPQMRAVAGYIIAPHPIIDGMLNPSYGIAHPSLEPHQQPSEIECSFNLK